MGTTHTRFSALLFADFNGTCDTWEEEGVSLIYLADADLCNISAPITTLTSPSKEP